MNILHINTLDQGGASKACIRLHTSLLGRGINSKLLVLDKTDSNILESYALYATKYQFWAKKIQHKLFYCKAHKIKNLPTSSEPFSFPFSAHSVHKNELIDWADIINLHWVTGFLDYPTFFKKVKKPIVWTLHDLQAFTGGYHYEEEFPHEQYRRFIKENETIKLKAVKDCNLTVVSATSWLKQKSLHSKAFSNLPNEVIPHSLNTSLFKNTNRKWAKEFLGLPTNKKILLFVSASTTNKRKGLHYLMEAINILEDKEIILAVVGSHINDFESSSKIFKLGRIYDDRLMALIYAASDLFITPAIEEAFGQTTSESLCCGTPVTAFNRGIAAETITDGKNGFICHTISSKALANTLKKALATNFNREWIREDAVARFDESIHIASYLKLYESILAS